MFIVNWGMDADTWILASNTVDGGLGSVETIGKKDLVDLFSDEKKSENVNVVPPSPKAS